MNELSCIEATLRKAASRRRLDRALRGLWIGLLAGVGLWLLLVATYKLLPIPAAFADWAWTVALAAALAGFLAGGWRRVTLATAARVVEDREALDQRLSTALEMARRDAQGPWTPLLLADAAAVVRRVDPSRLLPIGLPRFARWIPVLLAVVVGLGFVPEYRSAAHLQAQRAATLIRDTGKTMAEVVRRELARREPDQEPVRNALEETAALGDRLSQLRLTKAEAVKDLANAAARLRDEARALDTDPVLRRLQQAARSPSNQQTQGNDALQRQLEKLRQHTGGSSPDELERLAEKLEKAREMAAGMQGAAPDAAAQQALSQALQQLAESAGNLGLDLSSLNDALQALDNLNIDRVLQDLQLAGDDLDKLRDMARKLSEMQQSMAQLGKDLAEQLERGQAESAAQTLDRMVEQLQSASLTPEQMNQMLAEVSKALQPAGEYGEVADLLKKAVENLAANQKPEAGAQLAQAASELRQLAQQAQDLQQLASVLQALDGAKLALMNDRLWRHGGTCKGGNCPGCGAGNCKGNKLSWSQGGRPGRGVGTWADENGWLYYPEISERWDNTGIERPDMNPRGHTDRGDGQLSENALPTKLSGQFTPGPMPAITLKGVSIKGQSSVPFQQALETAQSEAQSALNQDQVPRAYRGAVKGYFDDLK